MATTQDARQALARARQDGATARVRAEKLEGEARRVTEAAERTAREAAAIAARIQESQALIAAQEARGRLIAREREALRIRLARRQQPLVRLTAALQRLSRRPPALALLRPGSVRETVHLRALLATILPRVERETAALRAEIARARALERQAALAAGELRAGQRQLAERRRQITALESRQRLASREVSGLASRESERALALAEKAIDLETLVEQVGRQGALREELARLPGPIPRPARPGEARVAEAQALDAAGVGASSPALPGYVLPVTGTVVTGFGEQPQGLARSRGIAIATSPGAQAVAPAPGRVAFAGPYRGYGRIVIIEHEGGWTSLVTGLVQLDTHVGAELVAGSPLGLAAPRDATVMVELRRDGEPVNPLQYLAPS
ncbi:MAG TPA: peptidoglycan DD-metalloendopeptidase family protein [Novosphingobium sp.]|nr:peptidoglycan DD-metalloendopeptidase family protein [Novosphingobium sp.]